MRDDTGNEKRKTYQAPRVTVISLRPEEAVLGHCKTTGQGGPVSLGCSVAGGSPCNTPGS
jgi:hypothetical protein